MGDNSLDTINEFLIEKGFIVSPADKHLQKKKMNVLILSYFWADIKHLAKTDEIMEVWKQNLAAIKGLEEYSNILDFDIELHRPVYRRDIRIIDKKTFTNILKFKGERESYNWYICEKNFPSIDNYCILNVKSNYFSILFLYFISHHI